MNNCQSALPIFCPFQMLYPVNTLRQITLDSAKTEYVFLVDADFIPDPGLHNTIKTYVSQGLVHNKDVSTWLMLRLEKNRNIFENSYYR